MSKYKLKEDCFRSPTDDMLETAAYCQIEANIGYLSVYCVLSRQKRGILSQFT